MRRYSNQDTVPKTLQSLRRSGLITPDGRPVHQPNRADDEITPGQPFKLNQRLKPAIVAEIVARYQAGETSTAVAAAYGLSKGSVIRLLRDAGVPIRRQGLTDDQTTEAAHLYESGLSLARIGEHFDVDHGTVWRALKNQGVKMRDGHGRST